MRDVILLFYNDQTLAVFVDPNKAHRFFQSANLILADVSATDRVLMALDTQQTPLRMHSAHAQVTLAFMPFGHTRIDASPGISHIGFTGERLDGLSGCYPLGAGYRYYNPVLMRFQSGDSMSPFLKGGINRYGYCLNDPINRTDPSGHWPTSGRWLGFRFRFRRHAAPRQETASTARTPIGATDIHAVNDPSFQSWQNRPRPPSYFGCGEPPPPYKQSSRQNTFTGAPSYSEFPLPAEQVLEFRDGGLQEVKSLLAYDNALWRSRSPSSSFVTQSTAITTLQRLAKDPRPWQTDRGIRDAARTVRQLYDIRRDRP